MDSEVAARERIPRRAIDRYLDWERLRTVGRLPLFGFSYFVLILIPFLLYLRAAYNHWIIASRTWVQKVGTAAQGLSHADSAGRDSLAESVLPHLRVLPIPGQSLLILTSTVLLAI